VGWRLEVSLDQLLFSSHRHATQFGFLGGRLTGSLTKPQPLSLGSLELCRYLNGCILTGCSSFAGCGRRGLPRQPRDGPLDSWRQGLQRARAEAAAHQATHRGQRLERSVREHPAHAEAHHNWAATTEQLIDVWPWRCCVSSTQPEARRAGHLGRAVSSRTLPG